MRVRAFRDSTPGCDFFSSRLARDLCPQGLKISRYRVFGLGSTGCNPGLEFGISGLREFRPAASGLEQAIRDEIANL